MNVQELEAFRLGFATEVKEMSDQDIRNVFHHVIQLMEEGLEIGEMTTVQFQEISLEGRKRGIYLPH